jgi:hypothetical protein
LEPAPSHRPKAEQSAKARYFVLFQQVNYGFVPTVP